MKKAILKYGVSVLIVVCNRADAQIAGISLLGANGTLTWTSSLANASVTVEQTTNLAEGPWLPVRHVVDAVGRGWIGLPSNAVPTVFYRLSVEDRSRVPGGMALVPGGAFRMGDCYSEGFSNARPAHVVHVSGFLMDRFTVSNEEMRRVLQWALEHGLVGANGTTVTNREGTSRELLNLAGNDHGYPYTHMGYSNGMFTIVAGWEQFPCSGVTWCGAQAYCNYRSDMDGLARCIEFSDWSCDFGRLGYRLPTEAEWEKAARGGLTGHHYPWESYGGSYSDHIDGSRANYNGSRDPYEPWATPVGYYNGNQIPVGVDMANGYGLYDMAGNVWQWCWDAWQKDWYEQPEASQADTRGPFIQPGYQYVTVRVIRGGSIGYYNTVYLTCASRHTAGYGLSFASEALGFRCVRGL